MGMAAIALSLLLFFSFQTNNQQTLTGAAIGVQNSGNGSQCGGINQSTTLTANVSSAGTCFVINASNIVLNCQGFEINYSTSGTLGYGVNNSGFDNVTIKNCIIKEGSSNTTIQKNAIFFLSDAQNGTIYNNTITIIGNNSAAIYLQISNRTNISDNVILLRADAEGLDLDTTGLTSIYYNRFHLTNGNSGTTQAITVQNGPNTANVIFANNITVAGYGTGIELGNNGYNNVFWNNTITTLADPVINNNNENGNNSLIYNGTYGMINWSNIATTNISLISGITIFIENNNLGIIDSPQMGSLNGTSPTKIILRGLTAVKTPQLLKAGVRCDNINLCNMTYNSTSGELSANVSSFSNYSIQEIDAPFVSITNPANSSNFSSGLQAFNATVREFSISTVRFVFDNSTGIDFNLTPTNVSGNWNINVNISLFVEGESHNLVVSANDSTNLLNDTVTLRFTVDKTIPNVTSFTLNNFTDFVNLSPGLSSHFISLNATVNDSYSIYAVLFEINSTNGSLFNVSASKFASRWNATINLSLLTESVHSARVYANDTAGNMNNTQYFTFLVNRTTPAGDGGGGGSSGGSSGGGGGGSSTSTKKETVSAETPLEQKPECATTSDCRNNFYCVASTCTRVFDIKIRDVERTDGEIAISYSAKNIIDRAGDVTVEFTIIDSSGAVVAQGTDVVYISNSQIDEQGNLFIPGDLPAGDYDIYVTLTLGDYTVKSYRSISIPEGMKAAVTPAEEPGFALPSPNLFGRAVSFAGDAVKGYRPYLLAGFIIAITSLVMLAHHYPRQSEADMLASWLQEGLQQGYSQQQLHQHLQQYSFTEMQIHLALGRVLAERGLQQRYAVTEKDLKRLKRQVQKQIRKGVPQQEIVDHLNQQWDVRLREEYVTAYSIQG